MIVRVRGRATHLHQGEQQGDPARNTFRCERSEVIGLALPHVSHGASATSGEPESGVMYEPAPLEARTEPHHPVHPLEHLAFT